MGCHAPFARRTPAPTGWLSLWVLWYRGTSHPKEVLANVTGHCADSGMGKGDARQSCRRGHSCGWVRWHAQHRQEPLMAKYFWKGSTLQQGSWGGARLENQGSIVRAEHFGKCSLPKRCSWPGPLSTAQIPGWRVASSIRLGSGRGHGADPC